MPGHRRSEVAILVVDDDHYVRDLVSLVLESTHARVVKAADADAARRAAAEHAFRLAIVDIGWPEGVCGYTLAADLRAIHAERGYVLPVVALTPQVPDAAAMANAGIVATVRKPFRIAELQAVVERHLDRRETPAATTSTCPAAMAAMAADGAPAT